MGERRRVKRDRVFRIGKLALAVIVVLEVGAVAWVALQDSNGPESTPGTLNTEQQDDAVSEDNEPREAPSEAPGSSKPERESEGVLPGPTTELPERHVNPVANYAFLYPRGWRLVEQGSVSRLRSEDRTVSVTFGLGPNGSVSRATNSYRKLLEGSYNNVRITSRTFEPDSRVLEGSAINDSGIVLLFRARVVQGTHTNFVMAGYVADAGEGTSSLDLVRKVLESFRPLSNA